MTDFLRVWKLPELSDRLTMLVYCAAEKIAVFSTENEKTKFSQPLLGGLRRATPFVSLPRHA